MTEPLLQLASVRKGYDHGGTELLALSEFSADFPAGELCAIVGPSGCGKSTLLRLVAGLLAPDRGSVRFRGAPVSGPAADRGMISQGRSIFPWYRAADNVALGLCYGGMAPRDRDARVRELLRLVGLQDFERAFPRQLSGGMQQRLALARALAPDPAALFMDEPFTSLDAVARLELQVWLSAVLRDRQKLVLFVTHDVDEALLLADRIVVLTARPGTVLDEHAVDLPYPRTSALLASRAFAAQRAHVLDLLVRATISRVERS